MTDIAHKYRSGEMLSSEIKEIMIGYVSTVISDHQEARSKITDDVLRTYFNRNRDFDMSHVDRPDIELESDETYDSYGVNFDKNFGAKMNEAEAERRKFGW